MFLCVYLLKVFALICLCVAFHAEGRHFEEYGSMLTRFGGLNNREYGGRKVSDIFDQF
jgi:hypothetical protein